MNGKSEQRTIRGVGQILQGRATFCCQNWPWGPYFSAKYSPGGDFLFDVHFVDFENFQPLARFKVQKFAEVTKFVLGFKCDSCAPDSRR